MICEFSVQLCTAMEYVGNLGNQRGSSSFFLVSPMKGVAAGRKPQMNDRQDILAMPFFPIFGVILHHEQYELAMR